MLNQTINRILLVTRADNDLPASRISTQHIAGYELMPGEAAATLTLMLASGVEDQYSLPPMNTDVCTYCLASLDDWFVGDPLPDGKEQPSVLDLSDLIAYVSDPENIDAARAIADEMLKGLLGRIGGTAPSGMFDALVTGELTTALADSPEADNIAANGFPPPVNPADIGRRSCTVRGEG